MSLSRKPLPYFDFILTLSLIPRDLFIISEVKIKEKVESSDSHNVKSGVVEKMDEKLSTNKGTDRSTLHVAVCNGLYEDVEKIIISYQNMSHGGSDKLKTDLHALDQLGFNPLHAAVTLQDGVRMARLLISAGAFATATDAFGNTPLHWAARVGNVKVMEILIMENCALGKYYLFCQWYTIIYLNHATNKRFFFEFC